MSRVELPTGEIVGIRAGNPGPLTLTGTNSWIVGRSPAWVVDPGPALPAHLEELMGELERRGGLGGIALTHDHIDHSEAVPAMRERFPQAPLGAARGEADVRLQDGARFGPLEVLSTPGHAPDHVAFLAGEAALTGDAVLGEGSVFIYPHPGALSGYLRSLARLRGRGPAVLCPGHGSPVYDVAAKLDEYIAHRLGRERRLLAALEAGKRAVEELLDEVWSDAPPALRAAATATLAAHLDKLQEEGRLPQGVERPSF